VVVVFFPKYSVTENLCNNSGEPQATRLLIIDTSFSTSEGINITPAFYVEQSDICYRWQEPELVSVAVRDVPYGFRQCQWQTPSVAAVTFFLILMSLTSV